jgi:hypothetical protein
VTNGKASRQARQDRAARLEEIKAAQARQARRRRILAGVGSLAAVAVVATLVTVALINDPPPQSPENIEVAGLQTFDDLSANHVDTAVAYKQSPPVGGDHASAWLNCGIYSEPVPDENAVHALEHGAVWMTYDPTKVAEADIQSLDEAIPDTYMVLSPLEGTESPIMMSAWGAQVGLDSPQDERLDLFVSKYWQSPDAPEPGAACTGGIDAPGRTA